MKNDQVHKLASMVVREMLSKETKEDIERYILLYYRPEGVRERHLNESDDKIPQTGGFAPGIVGAAIAPSFLKSIRSLVAKLDMTFSEKLMWWIKKQGREPVEVYELAGITKEHFSKIRKNSKYHPTKETALAFVMALHLNMEEAIDLLKRAGYALSQSSQSDIIVAYFLEHGIYKIDTINEALYSFGCKPLSNWRATK